MSPSELESSTRPVPASDRTRSLPTLRSLEELKGFLKATFQPKEYPFPQFSEYWITPEELSDIVDRYADLVDAYYLEYSGGESVDSCCVRLSPKNRMAGRPIDLVGLYPVNSPHDWGARYSFAPAYARAIPRLANAIGKYH